MLQHELSRLLYRLQALCGPDGRAPQANAQVAARIRARIAEIEHALTCNPECMGERAPEHLVM